MTTQNAKNLTLNEVHYLLKFQKLPNGLFTPLLSLEALTEFEQQELTQIRNDFDSYLTEGRVFEGLVKALTTFPLLRLAGFYRPPLKISLEQDIANIVIEDEDSTITGRLDILAVNKTQITTTDTSFWVLVIEAKNSSIAPLAGLPQLLTYALKVWNAKNLFGDS
jgi:RNA polymerase subunit RPABC4/transcription elongation factor Spt4